jgi:hypothetical protein
MGKILSYWWLGVAVSVVALFVLSLNARIVDLNITKAFYDLRSIRTALEKHKASTGNYPTDLQALTAGTLSYLPVDPWGTRYLYRLGKDKTKYELYSAGFDRRDERGGGDDVTDETKEYDCKLYGVNCPPSVALVGSWFFLGLCAVSLMAGLSRLVRMARRWARKPRNAV